jgi:CheY-like chemotaxis protein
MMGGIVFVESRDGAGSTFNFSARLSLANQSPRGGTTARMDKTQAAWLASHDEDGDSLRHQSKLARISFKQVVKLAPLQELPSRGVLAKTVLLLHHNSIFVDIMRRHLCSWGLNVTATCDRAQADTLLKTTKFTLLILAADQPSLSVLATMRQSHNRIAPVILLRTNLLQHDAFIKCTSLLLPVKIDTLFETVDKLLSKERAGKDTLELLASSLNTAGKLGDKNGPMSRHKVLVAEDNDINWTCTKAQLKMCGINAARAVNGKLCLDMMHASVQSGDPYTVVFMDIQVPTTCAHSPLICCLISLLTVLSLFSVLSFLSLFSYN